MALTGEITSDNSIIKMMLRDFKVINDRNSRKYEAKRQNKITEMKLDIIADLYNKGYTQKEIGEEIGESQQTISNRLNIINTDFYFLIENEASNRKQNKQQRKNKVLQEKQNNTNESFVETQEIQNSTNKSFVEIQEIQNDTKLKTCKTNKNNAFSAFTKNTNNTKDVDVDVDLNVDNNIDLDVDSSNVIQIKLYSNSNQRYYDVDINYDKDPDKFYLPANDANSPSWCHNEEAYYNRVEKIYDNKRKVYEFIDEYSPSIEQLKIIFPSFNDKTNNKAISFYNKIITERNMLIKEKA